MGRWKWLAALAVVATGCGGKKWPAADVEAQKQALECGPVRTPQYDQERCRMLEAFVRGRPFDAWPTDDATDVWLGRSRCVGQNFTSPTALRIKRGTPAADVIRLNHFEGFKLLPFVFNDDGIAGDFAVLQKAVSNGSPFDAEVIAAAKQEPGKVFFPLAATDNSVGAPTSHWRIDGDRLIVVTAPKSFVQCASELWKLP